MNTLYIKVGAALAIVLALFFGYRALANHYTDVGRAEIQAKWDADTKARQNAEKEAIAKREQENAAEKEKQNTITNSIKEQYNAELTQVRNELATSKRLRVGTAICSKGSASPAQASGTEGGDAADTGAGLVREDAERDLKSLMIKVEESFATGRACQGFIRENGFSGK